MLISKMAAAANHDGLLEQDRLKVTGKQEPHPSLFVWSCPSSAVQCGAVPHSDYSNYSNYSNDVLSF